MTLKEYLEEQKTKKEARAAEIRNLIQASTSVEEVRSLGTEKETIEKELNELRSQLENLETGDPVIDGADGGEARKNLNPLASYGLQQKSAETQKNTDPYDTAEYRSAFMEYVCRNTPIPAEARANAVTATGDAKAVIPTTILQEIIREMDTYGNIWAQVRKMSVQGGVAIPIADIKPTATWITADNGKSESDDQKLTAKESLIFNYFGVECKIAQTLLTSVVTFDMFQQIFVPLATEAIVRALELAIVKGSGTGQPMGITKDSRVPAKNVIELTEEEIRKWTVWKKKVFGNMKKSYRNGQFIMNQSTFDGYIDGMVDDNGQPIGRINYGIEGGETYRFGGKTVETVEDDIITAWDDAANGDIIGLFINLKDYAVNTNMAMEVVKWTDHDTNTMKNKAIMIADGKLVDPYGVLIIKKKVTAA